MSVATDADATIVPAPALPGLHEALLDAVGHAIVAVGATGLVVSWNTSAEQMYGWSAEEALGCRVRDLIDAGAEYDTAHEDLRAGASWSGEHVVRHRDGTLFTVAVTHTPMVDLNGTVVAVVGVGVDVTAAKLVEAELRDSRARFEAQFRVSPVPAYIWQRHGDDFILVDANDAAVVITSGAVRHEIGLLATDFLAQRPDLLTDLRRCADERTPESKHVGFRMHTTGQDLALVVDYAFVPPDLVMVHTRDVTGQQAAEDALLASEERSRMIIKTAGEGIWIIDAVGITTFVNGRMAAMLGYTAAEMVGTPALAYMDVEGQAIAAAGMGRSDADAPAQLDFRFKARDGSDVWTLIETNVFVDAAGRIGALAMVTDITERRREHLELRRSERRLADAQRIAHVGSFEIDIATGVVSWSDEHFRILGLDSNQEASARLFVPLVHREDMPILAAAWANAAQDGVAFDISYRIFRPDGEQRWVRTQAVPERDEDGTPIRMIGTLFDETERVEAERVRKVAEARFEHGFDQAAIGIAIVGLDGLAVEVNPALCALLDRPLGDLVGQRLSDFSGSEEPPLADAVLARVAIGHDTYAAERRYVRSNGSFVWASIHINLVRDERGEPDYFFVQVEDISRRKDMEEEVAHEAFHDHLTGLPNRALLTDRLALALAGIGRRGTQLAVMFLDLDHLKLLNDTAGHANGDEALQHTADCLAETLRPGDTLARFGGDEFVMVCEDVTVEEATEIAERVLHGLREPHVIDGRQVPLSASIGIALADNSATPQSLLQQADAAMYRAKERGRGRVELFDDALRAHAERRHATEFELKRAVEREEFVVYYQPIIDVATAAVIGAEALVRWQHPERGLVGPDAFIELAEESGLIVPIGAWVLEQACRELVEWQRYDPGFSVSVNLSVRQMSAPEVVPMVRDVLARTGVRGSDVCLELTESVLMDDVDYFGKILARLKELGVRLSIDDFGTGYSSLTYLKRFPVDEVKVDRSFVDGLGTDPHDTALVAVILAMAEALDLSVTAEGIESQDQLLHLRRSGCQKAQGFFLARPMPAVDMARLVADRRRLPPEEPAGPSARAGRV
ncbi:MAG: hypothetical protein QOG87_2212 [Actinomycetota bacterium]